LLRQKVAAWTAADEPIPDQSRAATPRPAEVAASDPGTLMLLDLFDGDRDAVTRVLDVAIRSIDGDVQRIAAGVGAHDRATVVATAHHLKGTCGDLHATRLREIAALIEHAATNDRPVVAPALLVELANAVQALKFEIESHQKQITVRT
jgi:HPt (histidine-containing phosphotransfer) domain-containing protein